jgi:uncharacterized protein YyaL (SSP411 family)
MIEQGIAMPWQRLYRNEIKPGEPPNNTPAFMWPSAMQLSALVAAARVEPRYLQPMQRFIDALQSYWANHYGIGGYDVLPVPKPPDRYYDDNCWIAIALTEAYEVTGAERYRKRAAETLRFIFSGEDDQLGGGIYWHEDKRESKNTCSCAPAAVAALRVYEITTDQAYLHDARRLVTWTTEHLQDDDGLFWDHVKLTGEIKRTKWSYNSALMLEANALLHKHTGEAQYLRAAQRIARAAIKQWIDGTTGGVKDGAPFAHMLLEALLRFDDSDREERQHIARRALTFVHEQTRDPNGWHAEPWDRPQHEPLTTVRLIDQASAARAYWVAAAAFAPTNSM